MEGFNMNFHEELNDSKVLNIKKSPDFGITGYGTAENWAITEWIAIPQRYSSGELLTTKARALYSETRIYILFHCEDKKLTATMNADFMDLLKEDVVEIFLLA